MLHPPEPSPGALASLYGTIRERFGYDFALYEQGSIRRRIDAVLAKCGWSGIEELEGELVLRPEIFGALLDDLTVQVSDMFRDGNVFRALRRDIVPLLAGYPHVKVWAAGCASGEEVYSIAIVLAEAGLLHRTQIYATDTSAGALRRAQEGIYSEAAASRFEQAYRAAGGQGCFADYYHSAYGSIAMRDVLRRRIVFFQHDLSIDHALGEMQLVLCRNVLLYFGIPLRERALAVFADALEGGGFLCLGAAESLPPASRQDFVAVAPSERIFRRRRR
jgi:chemotaxis protein methyltransferase CheR